MVMSRSTKTCTFGAAVSAHDLKKSEDRATDGKFYGFAKTRSLLLWFGPSTGNVKDAHGARFLECDPLCANPCIGQQLLTLDPPSQSCVLEYPELVIDLGDRPHFDTEPIMVTVQLPPVCTPLEIKLAFDETYHLPYLVHAFADGIFALPPLPPTYRKTVYLLASGGFDPVTT
jgi:hypothetical protein